MATIQNINETYMVKSNNFIDAIKELNGILEEFKNTSLNQTFTSLCELVEYEQNKFKSLIKKVYDHQKSLGLELNQVAMYGIFSQALFEINTIFDRIERNDKIQRSLIVYHSRLKIINSWVTVAGCTDQSDLLCQPQCSDDWSLIKKNMIEILPDSIETAKKQWRNFGKELKICYIAIGKNYGILPRNGNEVSNFLTNKVHEEIKNRDKTPEELDREEPLVSVYPKLKLSYIIKICNEMVFSTDADIDDDFKLVQTTMNFPILREVMNLNMSKSLKKVQEVFEHDNIKTNMKFYIPADMFNPILQEDLACYPKVRPKTVENKDVLTMDACNLIQKHILNKNVKNIGVSHFKIRLLCHKGLEKLNQYLQAKNYKKRVQSPDSEKYMSTLAEPKQKNFFKSWISNVLCLNLAGKKQKEAKKGLIPPSKLNKNYFSSPVKMINTSSNNAKPEISAETDTRQESYVNEKEFKDITKNIDPYLEKLTCPEKLKEFAVENLLDCSPEFDWQKLEYDNLFKTVIIFYHGGGFSVTPSFNHCHYLIKWANVLKVPVFAIDYRSTPEARSHEILNDCISGYLWVQYFIEKILKVKIENLIVSGDSSGGNIGNALTNWCIVNGIRKPDFLFVHVPIYNYCDNSFTPSKFFSWDDSLIGLKVMRMFAAYYITEDVDAFNDSYQSPICTPDWILKEYPEFACLIAEYDILRDDALRLVLRMLKLDKQVKILYAREMKHDPVCFTLKGAGISQTKNCMDQTLKVFKNWIEKRTENQNPENIENLRGMSSEKQIVDRITGWINS